MSNAPPEPAPRCKFAQYLFERRLGPRDVAPRLGCSHEQVRRVCLPFADPNWRRPSAKLKQKIATYTRDEVALKDWAEPQRVPA